MDPRDSEDIESRVFEMVVEELGFTIFGNQMVQFPEPGIRFVNRLDDEFSLEHVWLELSVQYPNRLVK